MSKLPNHGDGGLRTPSDHGDGANDDHTPANFADGEPLFSEEQVAFMQEHRARWDSLQEAKRILGGIDGYLGVGLASTVQRVLDQEIRPCAIWRRPRTGILGAGGLCTWRQSRSRGTRGK